GFEGLPEPSDRYKIPVDRTGRRHTLRAPNLNQVVGCPIFPYKKYYPSNCIHCDVKRKRNVGVDHPKLMLIGPAHPLSMPQRQDYVREGNAGASRDEPKQNFLKAFISMQSSL